MGQCHCIIKHPESVQERQQMSAELDYARRIGDTNSIVLLAAQLSQVCPGQKHQPAEQTEGET